MSQITWEEIINVEKEKDYFQDLLLFLDRERNQGKEIFPQKEHVFSAFEYTEFDDVKVVILGQDPYHGPNQAHGLAFSVQPGIKVPPSLANIYKELESDIEDFEIPDHGYLASWAEQGVLLMNTVLTVEQGKAHSHAGSGWEIFTDHIIDVINKHQNGVIFLLWGAHAQRKGKNINKDNHYVLSAPHPSPLSAYRGFLGCHHFSEVNKILEKENKKTINWLLEKSV